MDAVCELLGRWWRGWQGGRALRAQPTHPHIPTTQADLFPDARDVFAFLEANGIGQKSALFYVARAARAEAARDFSGADAAFAAGVAAGATPANRLAARQAEFHARMAARVARQLAVGGGDGAAAPPPRRTALATVRPVAAGARGRTARVRMTASTTAPPPARSAGAAALDVFVDEDLSRATTTTAAARPGEGWTSLAPRSAAVKENEPAVSQWVGTTLPPSSTRGRRGGAPAPAPAPPLSIPADEGLEPAPTAAAPPRAKGGATALRKRLDGGGGADLAADPLAGHRADVAAAAAVAATAATDADATPPVDDLADVTLATRDALHAVGGFFAGALPGAAPWGDAPASPAYFDATADSGADATLSTRDALDALAAAFGGGGDDTLPLARGGGRPGSAGSPGGLDVREDTLFRMGGNGGTTGFEVREDTLFRLGAAAAAAAAPATTTPADENAPPPAADPENAAPRPRRSAKRGLGGGDGVLAEVAEGVEHDDEAEAALRAAPVEGGGDDFEVYCDDQ